MTTKPEAEPEFSRPVDIARLGDAESRHVIEARPDERAALAARFGLEALPSLRATVTIRRVRGGTAIRVGGTLAAEVVQSCIVSLAPVSSRIEESFEIVYVTAPSTEEVGFGADTAMDWPEPLPEGPLDVGEAVAQHLSLALNPYPRAPGAAPADNWATTPEAPENPFARLASLRKITPGSGEA